MSGFRWDVDPERAFGEGMDRWELALQRSLLTMGQYFAPQLESWMKGNAPWTDRTSNARQTLWCVASQEGRTVVIDFGYGVFYGKWLEYANGGRYAVIAPALDYWNPIITDAVNRMLK